jgi:HK97 family phage portal protein
MRFELPWSRKSTATMTSEQLLRDLIGSGGGSKAGVTVTREQAMQCVTAMRCARVIAEGLAQVPLRLMRKQGRTRAPATDHPLYELLALRPNEWMTSFELREMLGLHLVLCGHAYVWKNVFDNRVLELLPLDPTQVEVKRDGWELKYTVRMIDGTRLPVDAGEIWHLRGPSWDGVQGLDPLRLLREALGLAISAEAYGATFFGNGAQPGGILSTEQSLNEVQRKALREDWERRHQGAANGSKLAVLWGGMKFYPMATGNDAAQFLETRRFQVEQICSGFGVLPIMVGHADKSQTYASSEQQFLAHVTYTMGPWYARVEQSGAVALLTEQERRDGYYLKHVTNALMRGTFQARADFYTKLFSVGALSPNDIRELEDMDPYDGGDTYRVPLNTENPADPSAPATPDATPPQEGVPR